MSCGAVLLTFGEEGMRFADPNATVMIHDVSSGMYGKIEELKAREWDVFQTSAKDGSNVEELFHSLVNKITQ